MTTFANLCLLALLLTSAEAYRHGQGVLTNDDATGKAASALQALDDGAESQSDSWWIFGGKKDDEESENLTRRDTNVSDPNFDDASTQEVVTIGLEALEMAGWEESPYNFGSSWDKLNFEERWEQFRNAVPLEELQEMLHPEFDSAHVCHPSSVGPQESTKLAILIHGFTSCPGGLYPLTQRMVEAGFRVLRPTLPGHGRKFEHNATKTCTVAPLQGKQEVSDKCINHFLKYSCNWTQTAGCEENTAKPSKQAYKCCCEEGLQDLEAGEVPCRGKTIEHEYQDDLSQMPVSPGPYLVFAQALGRLVEQFKAEHPSGLVVVAGHSLGGLVAAKFSLERPQLVDRLLLMNPMFGLSSSFAKPVVKLGGGVRVSWTGLGEPECDSRRSQGVGGYCQFQLANIGAMADTAYLVLCRHWGLKEYCKFRGGTALGMAAGLGTTGGLIAGMAGGATAATVATGGAAAHFAAAGTAASIAGGAAAAGTGAAVAVGSVAGWTPFIYTAAAAGFTGVAMKAAVVQSVVMTSLAIKGTVAFGIAGAAATKAGLLAAAAAGAAKAGAVAGGAAGLAAGPAAPAAVPVGAIVGAVIATLAIGIAAGVVTKIVMDKAAEAAAVMGIRNQTLAEEVRLNFTYLKEFQILSSKKDPAIDNTILGNLMKEFHKSRYVYATAHRGPIFQRAVLSGLGLAFWPKEVGHGYNNNRFNEDKWFQPYVENVVGDFCANGHMVPALKHRGDYYEALNKPDEMYDGALTLIPSYAHFRPGQKREYRISHAGLTDLPGQNASTLAPTLFYGRIQRACGHRMFQRRFDDYELVDPKFQNLLVLARREREGSSIDTLLVLKSPVQVTEDCDKVCISADKVPSLDPYAPLYPQLNSLETHKNFESGIHLCKDRFVERICKILECKDYWT